MRGEKKMKKENRDLLACVDIGEGGSYYLFIFSNLFFFHIP